MPPHQSYSRANTCLSHARDKWNVEPLDRPTAYPDRTPRGGVHLEYHSVRRPTESRRIGAKALLDKVLRQEFVEPLYHMHPDFPLRYFDNEPLISELATALSAPDSVLLVDEFLDGVFGDFKEGEMFAHTEVVMGLLVALKKTQTRALLAVVARFAEAKGAEFRGLRRLATELLR